MSRDTTIALLDDATTEDAALLCRGMEETLRYAGIAQTVVTEAQVETGALERVRLALLPRYSNPSAAALRALEDFVRRGGKLILGLNPASELLGWLGLKRLKIKPMALREMVFTHKALHALPPRVFLSTRQIALFKAEPDVKALAQWRTLEDLGMNDPAVYLAPHGALLTTALAGAGEHAQFAEDRIHLGRLIATLANHFLPGFDLLRFQRQLTERLSREEELVREARTRDFEVRALWTPQIPTPNECALIARQNFNVLCPPVGAIAAHHYERATFHRPWPLAHALTECIDQAHRSGLEVFPYLTAWPLPSDDIRRFFDGTGRALKPGQPSTSETPPSAIGDPIWMCPSHPDNQQLLIDSVTRLLDEFGVDGVVLAGLRFPDEDSCGCEGCRQRFAERNERKLGSRPMNLTQQRAVWQNWRHEVLTDVLKRLLTACRATNPNARLALATLPSWDQLPKRFGQDPAAWAQQNLADVFIPLDFTAQPDAFRAELDHQRHCVGDPIRLCAGISVYSRASEISSAADLASQIQVTRDLGAEGFLLWHSEPPLFQAQFGESLRAGVMRAAVKPPWHPNAPSRDAARALPSPAKAPLRRAVLPLGEA